MEGSAKFAEQIGKISQPSSAENLANTNALVQEQEKQRVANEQNALNIANELLKTNPFSTQLDDIIKKNP
jgi:hypothetical protein